MKFLFLLISAMLATAAPGFADVPLSPAGSETVLKIGGLLQVQADVGDRGDGRFTTGDDRFYLRRARLNLTGSFAEHFDFRLEADLSASLSNNAASISTSNLRAQMTDGYVNWSRYAMANIRGGQFKTPYGFEQLYADPRLFTIERSLVNDRLTIGRQIGAMLSGDVFGKRLQYASGFFNGNNVNVSFNDNNRFLFAGRVSGVVFQGDVVGQKTRWTAGADIYDSEDKNLTGMSSDFQFAGNTFTGTRRGVGFDTQWQSGSLSVWFEYLAVRFRPEDGVPTSEFTPRGWYVLAVYAFHPKFQSIVRYETFDPKIITGPTDTWTFGANYLIKGDDLKLQVNYLLTDAAGISEKQNKVLCRFQVMF